MLVNFKYFQGLETGLLKFKGFQDATNPVNSARYAS